MLQRDIDQSQELKSGSDRESGMRPRTRSTSQERPEISPRLRAATRLRFAALGGFEPSQARPQQAPLVGAALVMVLPSVAAWAALEHQVTHRWVAPVALRYVALGGFGPSQARPQQAPLVGAALVALAGGGHQQALCGAALVTSVPQGCWSGWQDSGQVSS